jgi:hypothetical protein
MYLWYNSHRVLLYPQVGRSLRAEDRLPSLSTTRLALSPTVGDDIYTTNALLYGIIAAERLLYPHPVVSACAERRLPSLSRRLALSATAAMTFIPQTRCVYGIKTRAAIIPGCRSVPPAAGDGCHPCRDRLASRGNCGDELLPHTAAFNGIIQMRERMERGWRKGVSFIWTTRDRSRRKFPFPRQGPMRFYIVST